MKGGWRAHPDAVDNPTDLPPVEPGRAVGLGAICDLRPQRPDDPDSQSFSVSEFVTLDDGRRVILHSDRGFTIGWGPADQPRTDAAPAGETPDSITKNVLNAVLPDDENSTEEHPWSWLANRARARGLDVTAQDLRGLPYEVILTDKVTRWLTPPA